MRVAIVTGANKGIGNGIVELLARGLKPVFNWHIYLTARNEKLGLEAVNAFEGKGLGVKFHQLDITDADSRHKLAKFVRANYVDGIDILVNNAGIAYKLDSTAPFCEQARVTVATNYTATVKMCTEFLPLMAKDSRLVNVASTVDFMSLGAMSKEMAAKLKGHLTLQELDELMASFVKHAEAGDHKKVGFSNSPYGMSKVGLWKATAILAEEFKSDPRHILINSCSPGYVNTDMTNHKGPKTILEGADTPVYLATLPKGATEPHGQFVRERQVVDMDKVYPL
ncbi:carbonyl reductase 1 [Echinococcus multilocularis]|uniref:carbonyl reductase (NADPH) n=1 Tax=Echinococcus multilocularis TaxID=6211 RepID=A0A087VYW5_ECHMU|nr:carbonyl reductase 1 [Echinococcus multilocularis]